MQIAIRILILVSMGILATGASAREPRHLEDGGHIGAALEAGDIDETEALWLRYLQHFEPEQLPVRYHGERREGIACGTGLVMEIRDHWDWFDVVQRARMTAQLAPWKANLQDEVPITLPAAEGERADDTCWGQYGANRVLGEHFSVEWDDGVSSNTANQFLEALEYSWEMEVDKLGWRAPEGSDNYLIMAYIDESNYGGAYTSVDMCNSKYIPYIVAGSGSFGGGSHWYMDMAAHEFNHAMQFGYGYANEFWWWEATATYIEEQVYSNHDSWAPYVTGYTENPWMAMNAESQSNQDIFYHMYGMCIVGFHLDNHAGDHDLVRQMWDESQFYPDDYGLRIHDLLEDMGYDWLSIYREFLAVNTVMDYTEQNAYPSINLEHSVNELPAEGQAESPTKPQPLGQNFIRIDPDSATAGEPDLVVEFAGDEASNWMVILVGTIDDRVEEVVEVEWSAAAEGGARLEDLGRFDNAWLVVSPLTGNSSGKDYSWTASVAEGLGDDDDTSDDDDGADDDAIIGGEGCNCTLGTVTPAPIAALGMVLIALVIRRRR